VDISAWLRGLGLERYEAAFLDNEITPAVLPHLSDADLRELGLPLGPRKLVLTAIAALDRPPPDLQALPVSEHTVAPPSSAFRRQQAERRQITVLFADLVGSTAVSTILDPEDMRDVLRLYQDTVTAEIARVGGHVAKLMGDGVLAYFGWPHAQEDDPERAVRAGLAVVSAVRRLTLPNEEPLATRVGISTGLVVVGDLIGEGAAQEEAVVGETPNLAARLQAVADPHAVVVSERTRRLLGEVFDLVDLGALQLKGFSDPVACFQVLREQPSHSRYDTQHSGRAMPMLGRDQELALVLERWQQAVAGEGQGVLLVGEAGIGKSRLVQAVLDSVSREETVVLRYQCSPHHTGTALWPFVQQLTFAMGVTLTDSCSEKLDKLEGLLRLGNENTSESVPLVAALLSLNLDERFTPLSLTAHQQRARTLVVLVNQLIGLARKEPVLMVVEDTHWIDPTTLDLLGQVLDQIPNAPVLILITSRPDHQPALGGHPNVTRLTLNRLGRKPTEAIIAHLLGEKDLPAEVISEIVARTDGMPLFVEELTKAVLDTGLETAVPVSLSASLMARLDRVPGVKDVATVASCIGREFDYRLLEMIISLPGSELTAALDRLTAAELVFRRGTPPEAVFTFKHALVRDAAHESLLKKSRQELHGRIARTLEERFPETISQQPEVLALHCAEAGQDDKAVFYWQLAGQRALERCAMAEAVVLLTRGLQALKSFPQGAERQRQELALQFALGRAFLAAKGFAAPETGRAYARARDLCGEVGEVPEYFPILYGQSVFYFQRGELTKALEVAQDLLRGGKTRGDISAQVTGRRMIGSALCQLGRFVDSRDEFEAALSLYDPIRDRSSGTVYAIDSRVMSLCWLAHLYAILGNPEQAFAREAAVPGLVEALKHPNTTAVSHAWNCIFRQLIGDVDGATQVANAAITVSTDHGFPLYRAAGLVIRGWAVARAGHPTEGLEEVRQGLTAYSATGAEMWAPYFSGLLAETLGGAGHASEGKEVLNQALTKAKQIQGLWIEAELYRVRGDLLLALSDGKQVEAEASYRLALSTAVEQNAALWELRAATSLARLRIHMGETCEAQSLLGSAVGRFSECGQCSDLTAARQLLTALGSR
jgi:class 3 adenylate cyclase/predicted ATPase